MPSEWLKSMREKFSLLSSLGGNEKAFCLEMESSMDVAATLVCVLWSSFVSHFPGEIWDEHFDDLVDSALVWLPLCGQDQVWIPVMKYQLSWLFASAEGQDELPERPACVYQRDGHVLLGSLGRRFRNFRCGNRYSHVSWRNTILHGIKKGLPQMGVEQVSKNLHALAKRLTSEKESSEEALAEIRRTTFESIGRIYTNDIIGVKPWVSVSGNSCYETDRKGGGVLGNIMEGYFGKMRHNPLIFYELACMSFSPRRGTTRSWYWPGERVDFAVKQARFKSWSSATDCGIAEVHKVLEPLKVRLISAADVNSNGLWSTLQKRMWSKLQRFEQYELTGKWVTVDDLWSVEIGSDDRFLDWCSGDYSAATDSLNADATAAAYGAIAGDPGVFNLLKKGLTNTRISFQKMREGGRGGAGAIPNCPEDFTMTSGQLMGSVFSFPLLCTINMAMYRWALERRLGYRVPLRDLPVRVNGDDILFKCDPALRAEWEKNIADVGFIKSVGKNYVSPNFAVINSVYFQCNKEKGYIRQMPYFNLGWCTGVQKGGGESDESWDPFRLIQCMKDLESWWIEAAPERRRQRNLELVKSFKREVLGWNKADISNTHLPLDEGPLGLRLSDEDSSSLKSDFRWHVLHKIEAKSSFGTALCPKTMVPWKQVLGVLNSTAGEPAIESLTREYWSFAKKYEKQSQEERDRIRFRNILRQVRKERQAGLNEFLDQGTLFGSF
jgi:hypothetical protein